MMATILSTFKVSSKLGDYNVILVENRSHGVTKGNGIGSIVIGFLSNASTNASLVVDDLQVGMSLILDNVIFKNDFELSF